MVTEVTEWQKYGVEAITHYRKAIFDFFHIPSISYAELNDQLGRQYARLCRAQSEIQRISYSYDPFESEILKLDDLREKLDNHANMQHLALFQEDAELYGVPYQKTMNRIRNFSETSVTDFLGNVERLLSLDDVDTFMEIVDDLFEISPFELIMCIWYLAMAKPFSANQFNYALNVYGRLFHESINDNPDLLAAYLYTRKQLAGDTAVQDGLSNQLREGQWDSVSLQVLASSMMWMQSYKAEEYILRYKLTNNLNLLPIEQERLNVLASGTTDNFSIPKTETEGFAVYVSSITWKDDDYSAFFEQLRREERTLPYALAIRDDDHDLIVPRGAKFPDEDSILRIIKETFDDEYEDDALVLSVNCVALSDAGEEVYTGYVTSSIECPDMAILTRLFKVGKHINVKLYTLYVPQAISADGTRKQVIALKNKLALSMNVWEKGLKDTMLFAIQRILNNGAPGNLQPDDPPHPQDDPIF